VAGGPGENQAGWPATDADRRYSAAWWMAYVFPRTMVDAPILSPSAYSQVPLTARLSLTSALRAMRACGARPDDEPFRAIAMARAAGGRRPRLPGREAIAGFQPPSCGSDRQLRGLQAVQGSSRGRRGALLPYAGGAVWRRRPRRLVRSRMEQTVDAGDALLQLVRTSSEVDPIAPSLRRSWRSGSGPSEGGDQLGCVIGTSRGTTSIATRPSSELRPESPPAVREQVRAALGASCLPSARCRAFDCDGQVLASS